MSKFQAMRDFYELYVANVCHETMDEIKKSKNQKTITKQEGFDNTLFYMVDQPG